MYSCPFFTVAGGPVRRCHMSGKQMWLSNPGEKTEATGVGMQERIRKEVAAVARKELCFWLDRIKKGDDPEPGGFSRNPWDRK